MTLGVIVVGFLSFLASTTAAQSSPDCRRAVQHLVLPRAVEAPGTHTGQPLSPIAFLYSVRGVDIYAVIFKTPKYAFVGGNTPYDVSLILVDEDEQVREEDIGELRGTAHIWVRQSDGTKPSLDNLKFKLMHCADAGVSMVKNGKCPIQDVQFFKPQACIVLPQMTTMEELSRAAISGVRDFHDALNPLNWLGGINDVPEQAQMEGQKPLVFKISDSGLALLKKFVAENLQ